MQLMKEKVVKVVPLLLVVVLLVSTLIAWRITQGVVEVEVGNNFNHEVQVAKHWLQDRLNLYLPITLSIRIFFEAGGDVTANEWSTYIHRLELIDKYPAISSISYIERVKGK
jgi:CHASE1-domain containing sensor protein